jgi:hypothetical protein
MANDNYSLIERIVDKAMGARYIIVLLMYSTLCYAVIKSFDIIALDTLNKELLAFRKEIFLYVMGVFSGLIGGMGTAYFTRNDRADKKDPKVP